MGLVQVTSRFLKMITDSSGGTDDDGIEMAASSSSFTVSCEDAATLLYYRQERSVDMSTLKTEEFFFFNSGLYASALI